MLIDSDAMATAVLGSPHALDATERLSVIQDLKWSHCDI